MNLDSLDICKACLDSDHYPNKTTLKSIKNVEAEKNITEYASLEDMIKKILGSVLNNK